MQPGGWDITTSENWSLQENLYESKKSKWERKKKRLGKSQLKAVKQKGMEAASDSQDP